MRTAHARVVNGLIADEYPATGTAGRDTVILFLSSICHSRRSWKYTIEAVSDQHRCLALDIPGQGDTKAPDYFMPVPDLADAVAGALVAAGVSDAVVVGNSLGGIVGTQLGLARPDLVSSLVLVGMPAWADESSRRRWLHARSRLLIGADGQPKEIEREFIEQIFGFYNSEWHHVMAEDTRKAGSALGSTLWALYGFDIAEALSRTRHRVLAVYGSNDALREESLPVLKQRVLDLETITIDGGSHLLPFDQPTSLSIHINGWLKSDGSAGFRRFSGGG